MTVIMIVDDFPRLPNFCQIMLDLSPVCSYLFDCKMIMCMLMLASMTVIVVVFLAIRIIIIMAVLLHKIGNILEAKLEKNLVNELVIVLHHFVESRAVTFTVTLLVFLLFFEAALEKRWHLFEYQ